MSKTNLILRFFLELAVLFFSAWWAMVHFEGYWRIGLMLIVPLLLATAWGTFAVPDDPSRSGKAPVPIGGLLRLILEIGIFGFAVWCLIDMDREMIALCFGSIVLLHYAFSLERIKWLIKQ